MLENGFQIDRYVVEEKLGEGGMAVVYRVRHSTLGTRHALKVLSITSRDVKERLIQEGRVQATLGHPNIVAVSDVLDVDGAPGLLMEFIQGPALDHWLYHYQPSIEEAVTLFRGIVAGVGMAHAKGLIHRDLKPGNVLLHIDERGIHPKVTDFGLAKLTEATDLKRTRTGTTMGTPAYMAPEQIRDASTVDRRADLYSLGVILYELCCGRTPYQETDIIELFAQVAAGEYTHPRELRPDLPNNLCDVIDGLLEVNRDHRFSDCASILQVLDGADKTSFTEPLVVGPGEALPAPRPLPDPGRTYLGPNTAAAAAARRFVRSIETAAPPPARPQDSPRPTGSGLDIDAQREATPLPAPSASTPRRSWALSILLLFMTSLVVFLFMMFLTTAGALVFNLGGDAPSGSIEVEVQPPDPVELPEVDPPAPLVEEPAPAPEPVPVPEPEPMSAKPASKPPPRPAPAPVEPKAFSANAASFVYDAHPDLARVVLTDANGNSYDPATPMEAGRYEIWIDTREHGGGVGGSVTLRAGQQTRLVCIPDMVQCKAQ